MCTDFSLEFKHSQKLPLKSLKQFTLWNVDLTYRFIHKSTLCCFWRENSPERGIQSAREWRKHRHFSDDSSESLWLVIALISSTASCVTGYNAALYKYVCLWHSAGQSTACFWAVWLSIWLHYKSTSGEIRVMACCDQACWQEAFKRDTEDLATCESFEGPEVINLCSFKCSWFLRLHVRGEGESGCPSLSSIILHWEGSGVPRPAGGAVPSLWRKLENSHRVERLFTSPWRLSLQLLHYVNV